MDITKQMSYWIEGANSDIETAELLIQNRKLLHGLFFCHLTIEKILKASVVKTTLEIPPKTHNLLRLQELAIVSLVKDELQLLDVLMIYQLEGRYPEYYPEIPTISFASDILTRTKTLLQCLKEKL